MSYYAGIDLGTSNSVIATFDGVKTRIWKSTGDDSEVTPSAIYIDRRNVEYYGDRAYKMAVYQPQDAARFFKRFIDANEIYHFEQADKDYSPIECSAIILRTLYGYLNEEIRNDPDTAVVITVPAAFSQTQKAATEEAARKAGFKKVALMQEPVAAVMSVMQTNSQEGYFVVYDLGGGTFDVSIAENIGGKVNLISQGGKPVCGGRDWDRLIFNEIIKPWLLKEYSLPVDFTNSEDYKSLYSFGVYAAENAKKRLSSCEETSIYETEEEIKTKDVKGRDIYFDIPLARSDLNRLIDELIDQTVEFTNSTIKNAGLTNGDIGRIVFVGGPTRYKPLRDKVCAALNIACDDSEDQMTAVAKGAAIFAESIDWSDQMHYRKTANAVSNISDSVRISYDARVAAGQARFLFTSDLSAPFNAEIKSADTGWTSGNIVLTNKQTQVMLPLSKHGENKFDVLIDNTIMTEIAIVKTRGNVGQIPASHSLMLEVLDRVGGESVAVYIVNKGDELPKKGEISLTAGASLKANAEGALAFNIWQGDIKNPIRANEEVGSYKIKGEDFSDGEIQIGAEITCEYEVSDSGELFLSVSVPSIRADFGKKNYYCYQDALVDLEAADKIADEAKNLLKKVEKIPKKINDSRLTAVKQKAEKVASIENEPNDGEKHEKIVESRENLKDAKQLFAEIIETYQGDIWQGELDDCIWEFNNKTRKHASAEDAEKFDNLARAAQRIIDRDEPGFEKALKDMSNLKFAINWKQDWYVIEMFNTLTDFSFMYTDKERFAELKEKGKQLIQDDKIDELRQLISELFSIMVSNTNAEIPIESVNIVRGQ